MSFGTHWHPECTATCFIIVTIVEIHRLIIDVCCAFIEKAKNGSFYNDSAAV